MKKIIAAISVVFILIIGIFMIASKEDYAETSTLILQQIIKGDYETFEDRFGVRYSKNIEDGGIPYNLLEEKIGDIYDFEYRDSKITNTSKTYIYIIQTEHKNYFIQMVWEKQPRKWMIASLDIVKPDDSIPSKVDEALVHEIMDALIDSDFETLFDYCSSDFGQAIDLDVKKAEDLKMYVENHFYFTKPRFINYMITELYYDQNKNKNTCLIGVNQGYSHSFNLKLLFDNSNALTGLFIVELDKITDDVIFNLSTDVTEGTDAAYNSANIMLADEQYNLYMNDLNVMYANMSTVFRQSLTIDEFKSYLSHMINRTGLKNMTMKWAQFTDWNEDYDLNHYSGRHIIEHDDQLYPKWISEKEPLKIMSYLNLYNDISVDKDDLTIEGLFFSRVDIYGTDMEVYSSLNDIDQQELYVPINLGLSSTLTEDENSKMRFDEANRLIDALIHEDYDTLWDIESKYTAYTDISELKKLLELQKKVVHSFNGAYRPVKGYDWLITGQYIMEYAFMTFDGDLNKLIISFDQDNEIMDFNVLRVPRKDDYETE